LNRIQQALLDADIVTIEQLEEAIATKKSFLESLLELDGINSMAVMHTLAALYRVPFIDISSFKPNQDLIKLIPEKQCLESCIVPIDMQENSIIVAMSDPSDINLIDRLQFKLNKQIKPIFVRPDVIQKKIRDFYQGDAAFDDAMASLDEDQSFSTEEVEDEDSDSIDSLKKQSGDSPIIKLVNGIIVKAMKMGSSDIHIEPGERISIVRVRVDGRLRAALKFPLKAHKLVASRVKIISDLDISNTRMPQDGRARIRLWGKSFDMRVSTLPSFHGEKIVIRILDKSNLSLDLDLLSFEKKADLRIRECIARSNGAVLVTGPTGSGKTTTLYSFLNHINDPETNIITVEDPVEFQIKGINQVQISTKKGLTFAAALRSILRQDPDVVMIGEIRDEETAEIALHAAQTGHLVLSTLHTNDAPSTVTRLIEMGLDAATLSSSLNMVVAQRLARRLCKKCKKEIETPKDFKEKFNVPDHVKFFGPVGCKECMDIGYKGRIGIHEVMYFNDELREAVMRGASTRELNRAACENGMFMLFDDGIDKALMGLTSIEEVIRNSVPPDSFDLEQRLSPDGRLLSLGDAKFNREDQSLGQLSSSEKKPIIVADDSKSIRNLVRFVLQAEEYEVIEAEDGVQAWQLLQRYGSKIGLVITDFEMPNMNGDELVKRIREEKKYNSLPIILLTSRKEEEDEVLGLDSGADDYIGKPVEPMKLQARVRKVLGMYERIRSSAAANSGAVS